MKRRLIIVSAPSGAGKSTLCGMALNEFPALVDSISYTTRQPRAGESEGHPYHFVTTTDFERLRDQGFFAEWARVHENYYGTAISQLESIWAENKFVIMDVDVQGAASLKRKFPEARSIFIMPPSLDELRQRVTARDQGKTNNLELRLQNAAREIKEAPRFDYVIINADIEKAYVEFKKIIEVIIKDR